MTGMYIKIRNLLYKEMKDTFKINNYTLIQCKRLQLTKVNLFQ